MLPPLLVELRNDALQALVLPLVLGIIPQQDEPDFMDWTLPSLLPIATSAKVFQSAAQRLVEPCLATAGCRCCAAGLDLCSRAGPEIQASEAACRVGMCTLH